MEQVANNIQAICQAVMPYTVTLVIVAFVVIGAMFIVPSDEAHQKAKKAVPWVIVGAIVLLGAVSIADWFNGIISF